MTRRLIGDESTVRAHRGDELVIVLSENASTGYVWVVNSIPEFLQLAGDESHYAASAAPGQAGERHFTFLATEAGTGEVTLSLSRPWEPAGAPEAVRAVVVTVEP
jgi:inhibitor of cysteine peptidase